VEKRIEVKSSEGKRLELARGRLRLSVNPSSSNISLFWDNTELTKGAGFVGITGIERQPHLYSDRALWQADKISDNELSITLGWPEAPVTQFWSIVLKNEKSIVWKIALILGEKIDLREQEAGLLLSPYYDRWINSSEEGLFPEIRRQQREWMNIKVKNLSAKSIGVRSRAGGALCRPAAILGFKDTKGHTEPEIRCSHFSANLRALFVLVKPDARLRDSLINKKLDVFTGEVRLIDNNAALANHIKSCRKEDKKRFLEQSYLRKRREAGRSRYNLFSKLKRQSLFNKLKFKKQGKREGIVHKLESGRLGLLINAAKPSVTMHWDGAQISRHCGFITIIGNKRLKRYYSDQAVWKLESASHRHVDILLNWPRFPAVQKWRITLEGEKVIKWDIWMIPGRRIALAEKEAGIFLSPGYSHWINSYEEGVFSKIKPRQRYWQDMKVWNLSSKSIGVRTDSRSKGSMPAVILDYAAIKEETEPKIRNSNYKMDMRALLTHVKPSMPLKRYEPGRQHRIFSGKISILDNKKLVEEHILNCKKNLYRERPPFIEEKMHIRYLSAVLKPVDVLLVNLPWKANGSWGVRAGSRWPHIKDSDEKDYLPFPFFLAYTASVLLRHGISVRVIDAIAEYMEQDDFKGLVDELEPSLLVAEVSTPSLKNDLDLLARIRKKDTKIAVCGLDFNIREQGFLKENDFIDFVMIGEYEYTALELINCIKNSKGLNKVKGLIYKENGGVRVNPPRPLIDNLDELPWPLREQLPMERYIDAPGNIPVPCAQMWASRGCPFQCTFCAWPQLMYNGNRYRMRNPKAIADEMEYLVRERKFKSVYFDDDSFNINKKNILDLCREIKERSLNVPWAVMARADTMDKEMLMVMKAAGLHAVKYGVESAKQELLDNAGKNLNLKKAEEMIRFTKSLGVKTHLTFTFGLPGETEETIKRTIDYAIELDSDTVQFSIMTPYPGTEYYRQLDVKGHIISKDWSDYDGASKSVIRTEQLSEKDLENARKRALRMWKRHKRSKRSLFTAVFDTELRAAFKNNLKKKGLLGTLSKTAKFVFSR